MTVCGKTLAALILFSPNAVFAQASTLSKAVRTSESIEPALSFPAQERVAQGKLDTLRTRIGKRPNIVWLVIDDMGYGDPGVYGGGAMIGAATPNIDRLAHEGLMLTSIVLAANVYADTFGKLNRTTPGTDRPNSSSSRRR
jgi:hypothetical protein